MELKNNNCYGINAIWKSFLSARKLKHFEMLQNYVDENDILGYLKAIALAKNSMFSPF